MYAAFCLLPAAVGGGWNVFPGHGRPTLPAAAAAARVLLLPVGRQLGGLQRRRAMVYEPCMCKKQRVVAAVWLFTVHCRRRVFARARGFFLIPMTTAYQ